MKTLERYVFGSFLSSFLLAFVVLSFVLTIGLMVQIVGYIMEGVPTSLVAEFCMVSIPETLQWSMPLALLVSSVLVFSRMSADSEIAAMRSCGVNVITVMRYPIIFAVLCTLVGFFINNEIVPRGHEVRRQLKTKVSVKTGLSVLEPGRTISEFPKVKLYFAAKEGNWLKDLVVWDFSNPKFDRLITAKKACVTQDGSDVNLQLYSMTVDPMDEDHRTMARASRFDYTLKDAIRNSTYRKRVKDFRFAEMLQHISRIKAEVSQTAEPERRKLLRRELSEHRVELSKRFVFAVASICFVLIGIPLGIRSQRRESTIGMAISLAVSLGYYVIVIMMLGCDSRYAMRPDLLLWLPPIVCTVLAACLVRRHL